MTTDLVIVLTTVSAQPDDEAGERIARVLVDEQLAACVNVLAPMTSIYRWKRTVERDLERQLVIKTTRERLPAVSARLAALHSYELPELIVLTVSDGSLAYLEWVRESTAVQPGPGKGMRESSNH
jgi:periplasmic divalent cation tolerance protein